MDDNDPLNAFVIMYADADVKPEYFCGHGAENIAHETFKSRSANWTCKLFRCIAASGYGPSSSSAGDHP